MCGRFTLRTPAKSIAQLFDVTAPDLNPRYNVALSQAVAAKDDHPFAFAGLCERWKGDGEEIESCSIIVTDANELVKPIHDRMPVNLAPEDYDLWLDPDFEGKAKLQELLRPFPAEEMEAYPVETIVNNPKNDVEECMVRLRKAL